MKKRYSIYAAFLAAILAVNSLSGIQFSQPKCYAAQEQQTPVADENGFVIENGVLTSYQGTSTEITIPETVTEIKTSALRGNTTITKVTVPGTVKNIPSYCFYSCQNLQTVEFLDGVATIGTSVFFQCDKLTSITIPASVTSIDANAIDLDKKSQFIIYGKSNTTAETFAKENAIAFNGSTTTATSDTEVTEDTSDTEVMEDTFDQAYGFKYCYQCSENAYLITLCLNANSKKIAKYKFKLTANKKTTTTEATTSTYIFKNLKVNTSYSVYGYAVDKNGKQLGDKSDTITFKINPQKRILLNACQMSPTTVGLSCAEFYTDVSYYKYYCGTSKKSLIAHKSTSNCYSYLLRPSNVSYGKLYFKIAAYKKDGKQILNTSDIVTITYDKSYLPANTSNFIFKNPSMEKRTDSTQLAYKATQQRLGITSSDFKDFKSTYVNAPYRSSGFCFGMSALYCLYQKNMLTSKEMTNNKKTTYLSQIKEPTGNYKEHFYNYLLYYFATQDYGKTRNVARQCSSSSYEQAIKTIGTKLSTASFPAILTFYVHDKKDDSVHGGHAVSVIKKKVSSKYTDYLICDCNHLYYYIWLRIYNDYSKMEIKAKTADSFEKCAPYTWDTGSYRVQLSGVITGSELSKTVDSLNLATFEYGKYKASINGKSLDDDTPIENTTIEDTEIRTTSMSFTIKHSNGKTATFENGKKVSGELETSEFSIADAFTDPIVYSLTIPNLKENETYEIIDNDADSVSQHTFRVMTDSNNGFYSSVTSDKATSITISSKGEVSVKTIDNSKATFYIVVDDNGKEWSFAQIKLTDTGVSTSKNTGILEVKPDHDVSGSISIDNAEDTKSASIENVDFKPDGTQIKAKNDIVTIEDTTGNVLTEQTMTKPVSEPLVEDDTEPETKTSLPKIKKTSITTLKNNAKSKVTVKCKMVMDADYYQIQYSLNKKFTKKQTKSKTLFANTKTTLKGLKKGKTYYVRVRAYCITLDGKKVYGKFSNVKKIKIKK